MSTLDDYNRERLCLEAEAVLRGIRAQVKKYERNHGEDRKDWASWMRADISERCEAAARIIYEIKQR